MSNFTRKVCKFFSSDFGKLVDKIEEAYNEKDKREKKLLYLKIKNKFEELKEEKRKSCNNIKKVDKKIDLIALLIIVLEYDIEINKSNMVKINNELSEVEKEINKLNISINTINKGEKILRKKIKELIDSMEFTTNVNILIGNIRNKKQQEELEKKRSNNFRNNLQKRLNALKGGKTRKLKH